MKLIHTILLMVLFLSIPITSNSTLNNGREWAIEQNTAYSWKVVQYRDTNNQIKESTWGDAGVVVTEGSVISVVVVDTLGSDILILTSYTSSENQNSYYYNLTSSLANDSLLYLGYTSFFLPTNDFFWDSLEHNLSKLYSENSLIKNDNLFYFKTQFGSHFVIEWSYDKNTGLLRNFIEHYNSFVTKHIERLDILESQKTQLFLERVLFGVVVFIVLASIMIYIRKK